MRVPAIVAGALLLAASSPALAGTYTLAGAATSSGGNLVLTPDVTFSAGAGYLNQAMSLGAGSSFNESFNFQIATPATGQYANGFAFFLATDPTGIGTQNNNLGLVPGGGSSNPSVPLAVEFYDFGNKNLNPYVGNGLYNSNLVAAITNGNTDVVANNQPGSYGSPGNVQVCTRQTSPTDCMNNGDVWSADVKYIAGKLYVTVQDMTANSAVFTIINGLSYALQNGQYYFGFSGTTGGGSDSVTVSNYSNVVPEPVTFGLFGVGIAALGFARSRRRSV